MKKYDVVIIGSGTSGQTAAFELTNQGLKIALIEKSKLAAKSHHLTGRTGK